MWQYISMKNRDTIAATVGGNLRTLRLDASLTLAELAGRPESASVRWSRSKGAAPTQAWRPWSAGRCAQHDFGRLIQSGEARASRIVRTADAAVGWSDERGSKARPVLISREPQSVELWQWLLKPGACYEAKPDPQGTDVLLMVTRGTLTLTVEGQASQMTAGTAGHITTGTGYTLANPGRADMAFTLVHIPPAAARARYTRAAAKPSSNA